MSTDGDKENRSISRVVCICTLEVTPKTYVLNFEGEAPERSIVTNLLNKYELISKIDNMTRAGMNMLHLSAFAMPQGEVRRC